MGGEQKYGRKLRLAAIALALLSWSDPSSAAEGGHAAKADKSHGAKADAEEGHSEDSTGHSRDRIVIVEPEKAIDPEIAKEEVSKYLGLGEAEWLGGDYEFAEMYFAAALGVPADVPEKEAVLSKMGQLYAEAAMIPKAAATLERLVREFPDSRRLPDTYMELGNLYRQVGALEMAISKYYMVMNSSLNVSFDQLEKYKELSLQAKLQIAETHAECRQYQEAKSKYENLLRLDLKPADRKRVHYRICYLMFELGEYQQAVAQLKLFIKTYPLSPHEPEIRYLLAKSYERLGRKPEALREVVEILQRQSSPDAADENAADYWKGRMGNELANEFYQNGDFRSALTIYQSLARYSADPTWRWPAIHQIGLCFERLGLPEKAILAYQEITKPAEDGEKQKELSEHLTALREMAQWRLEHLDWEDDLVARLSILRTK